MTENKSNQEVEDTSEGVTASVSSHDRFERYSDAQRLREELRKERVKSIWQWVSIAGLFLTILSALITFIISGPNTIEKVSRFFHGPLYIRFDAGEGSKESLLPTEVMLNNHGNNPFKNSENLVGCFLEVLVATDRYDDRGNLANVKLQFLIKGYDRIRRSKLDAFFHPSVTNLLGIVQGTRRMPGRIFCA
jgi:hypothetical protein